MKKPLCNVGDLVIFNDTGEFGNRNDRLFHIHAIRYDSTKKQYYYAGYLLEISEYESDGLPQIPVFWTTIIGASEEHLKVLEDLKIKFDIYK